MSGQRSDLRLNATLDERGFLQSWRQALSTATAHSRNQNDHPNYWTQQQSSLISTSTITSLSIGTGDSIYQNLRPAFESVSHDLILVTCFWAPSRTLDTFNSVLRSLSKKGQHSGRKIRVRIYFSSSSLFQKLFHTFSPDGQTYLPHQWPSKLGLPHPEELAGLDMQIKSIFFLPFCVMHPKFIILDRKQVFLPSCNISWEDWFEGCVGMTGPIVEQFVKFWLRFWATPEDRAIQFPYNDACEAGSLDATCDGFTHIDGQADQPSDLPFSKPMGLEGIKTVFLPSPHHINPCFRFPWQFFAAPPPTPLNTFLLLAMDMASTSIYVQTPNLTSPPVLDAILKMLSRPIRVHIVTSERLMVLEQLVTGGTTTSWCVKRLIRDYQTLAEKASLNRRADPEAMLGNVGQLKIEYYEPRKTNSGQGSAEPVQSHLKCTIVDGEVTVLGSGNLDRASWYTSQELGVAFFSKRFAQTMEGLLGKVLVGRKTLVYDSSLRS